MTTVTHPATAAPVAMNYREAAAYTGFGRTTLFEAVKAGHLTSIKAGKARRFMRADLDAWLESLRTTG